MRIPPLLLLASLTLGLLLPAMALATSPCIEFWPHGEATGFLPQQQETGVPTDTLIWFGITGLRELGREDLSSPTLVLLDEAADEVALADPLLLGTGSSMVVTWRPTSELAPLATYSLEATWPTLESDYDDPPESQTWSQVFVTAQDASGAAPGVPGLLQLDLETYANDFDTGYCYSQGPVDRVQAEVLGAGRVSVLFVADEAGQEGPADPFVGADAAAVGSLVELQGELPPASMLRLRAGTFDLAGNFSGWSEEQTASMPAAGCSSTKTFDQAALGLALLLVGCGLLRRRDLRRLMPVLLAAALGAGLLSPTTAAAEEPSETVETLAAPAEVELQDWRAPIAGRLATAERVWGGLAIAGGAAQLGFALALPFRAPGALSGTVGSVIGWGPALSGLLTTAAIRHHLLRTVSAERLEKALWAGFFVTIGVCAAAFAGAGIGGVMTAIFVDGRGGVFASMMGGALSVLSMNVTLGVYAGQVKRARAGGAVSGRGRPRAQVLAAGPTGLVVVF